jgi:CHAT domain-containing protein/Flp pilus assembly protein TadD
MALVMSAPPAEAGAGILPGPLSARNQISAAGQSDPDVYLLRPGEPVERTLLNAQIHLYQISLDAGQYLRLVVEQWGIDAGVALYQPGGQVIAELRCRLNGPTPVSLIARASGAYRLAIRSLENTPASGRYKVKIAEVRRVTATDERRVEAERALAAGEDLRLAWKAELRPKAIEKFADALAGWKVAGDQGEAAHALRQLGELYYQSGDTPKALDNYHQALLLSQAISDQQAEGDSLNGLCYIAIRSGEYQQASDYCNRALSLNQVTSNRRGEAQALNNLGLLGYSRGNLLKAVEYRHLALPLWQALADRRGQAQTLMHLGYAYSDLGETQKAFDSYEQALSLWLAVNDFWGQALTCTAIGHLYAKLGERQEALSAYHRAMQLFQVIGDLFEKGYALSGLGYVHDELGEKQIALQYYHQALRLYQAKGIKMGETTLLLKIGEVHHSLGDNQEALDYYQRALSIGQVADDPRVHARTLNDLGMAYHSLGKKTEALEYFERALALSRTSSDRRWEAYTLNNIGHVHDAVGEKQRALYYYKQSLPLSRAIGDHVEESLTLYHIARVERDRGNVSEARAQMEASLEAIESLRTKVASQELRASYFASVRQRYDFYVDLLMRMHQQRPAEGFAAEALHASERARARSMLELLAEARADLRQGVDPELLARERALQQLINGKSERQMRLLSSRGSEADAAAIATELQQLTAEYQEVRARIRKQSPRYAALTQPQPLTLREIQQQVLDADTLLLEYALGDERSYLWAVTPDALTSYELPKRAEIEAAARNVYDLLTARNQRRADETESQRLARVKQAEAEYASAADALSQMILGPVATQLGTKRLLIVSEGALQYVPFGALPVPAAKEREGRVSKRQRASRRVAASPHLRVSATPLIVHHEILNLPSASALAVLRRELAGREPAPKLIAVLADPVFAPDDERVRSSGQPATATGTGRSFGAPAALPVPATDLERAIGEMGVADERGGIARLLFSGREAAAILKLVPAQAAMKAVDFQASQETVTSADLDQYRIIHFATHGWFSPEHPELSGIVLSLVDEAGRSRDGFLQLHEIYQLKLSAELVVLSACQTALGKDIKGEGLVGLARGFMYAGAARVVASLWKVDDAATAELMKRFYQGMLKDGLTPAAALRAAQEAVWRQPARQSPYYWAAFALQGEWR